MTAATTMSAKIRKLRRDARDLLGYLRIENRVLSDDGMLSLEGLTIYKMALLRDLEALASDISVHIPEASEATDAAFISLMTDLEMLRRGLQQNTEIQMRNFLLKDQEAMPCH